MLYYATITTKILFDKAKDLFHMLRKKNSLNGLFIDKEPYTEHRETVELNLDVVVGVAFFIAFT